MWSAGSVGSDETEGRSDLMEREENKSRVVVLIFERVCVCVCLVEDEKLY